MHRLRTLLGSRWALALAVASTLLLAAPALRVGFVLDDHVHRETLQRVESRPQVAMTLFRFVATPAEVATWRTVGGFPWWTSPDLRLAFWRPLTALTHWLDYRLWPDSAPLQHAQSLAWGGLMTLLAGLFFRRFLGATAVAGLATLLYAVDDAHAWPLAWIANRNAVIATCCGVTALVCHDAWRRRDWRPGAVLGPLAFLASLLSAELGVATGAYLLAHALFLEPARSRSAPDSSLQATGHSRWWPGRLIPVLPYVAIGGVWQLVYGRLGFGAAASAFYLDPVGEPLRFLAAVPQRLLLLLAAQLGPLPSDAVSLLSTSARGFWLLADVAWVAFIAWFVWPLRRSATAAFFASGLVLSLIPLAATLPSDRLLTFAGVGAFGLIAERLSLSFQVLNKVPGDCQTTPRTTSSAAWTPPRRRVAAGVVLLVHGPLAALGMVGGIASLGQLRTLIDEPARALDLGPRPAEREVICLSAPGPFFYATAHIARHTLGLPMPYRMHALATGATPITVERLDQQTLRLTPRGGFLIPSGTLPGSEPPPTVSLYYVLQMMETLYRPTRTGFRVGDRFDVGATEIVVQATTSDGRPAAVDVHFPHPLDDSRYLWVRFRDQRYETVELPAVGSAMTLPAMTGQFP